MRFARREQADDRQAGSRSRDGVVSDMRRGGVGLCVATQIARYVAPENPLPGWHSPEQAWAMTQGQLAWYGAMEERGELVRSRAWTRSNRHVAALAGAGHQGRRLATC